MIQFLLENTNYSLKSIAKLSDSTIKEIRSIYTYNEMPVNFKSELKLVRLFHVILETCLYEKERSR